MRCLIFQTLEKNESRFSNGLLFGYFVGLMEQNPKDQLDFNFAADDLLEFPRDLGEEGWFQFNNEKKAAFRRVEKKFGIVLNKKVRLRLRGWDEEFTGRLVLDSLALPCPCAETVALRLGKLTFENTDIESLDVLED
ncbi:hypothetical protein EGM51_14350 [Verrucomicrobia bacterium S94]|nr:hypothetical protein EGM51_14350 [Verrucomicrobia bacterium S94]